MVGLAQMVRASDCGPEGRRFDPDIPPHITCGYQEVTNTGLCQRFDPDIPPHCGYSTTVSIQVFQTWDGGSIPPTRTREARRAFLLFYGITIDILSKV